MSHVFTLVLAGGSGTRFWPASRKDRPKQVLGMGPDTSLPLIGHTLRRVAPLCPESQMIVATGEALVEVTRQALPQLGPESFIAEPVAKNTAPCIAWAAQLIARRDPEAVVMVLPSDSHIGDEPEYRRILALALESAAAGTITTVGIEPTRPETGYGYIEAERALAPGVLAVNRFEEKPDLATAEKYVKSGKHYWNSGMFFFRAADMLRAVEQHLPAVHQLLQLIAAGAAAGPEAELEATRRAFASMPSISIDKGIMEKISPLAVVPGSFGWSDLGSWHTVWELGQRDHADNVGPDDSLFIDAHRNLIEDLRKKKTVRTIALLGISDLCVVETDDAVLIMPRDRAQDVRLIVDELTRRGGPV
ncbi:MAG TPA: sugar phosphate nucleotidyltransferase [Polyangiaceae bacterium]|nr:sugar phosphate nucleotidyltransferase [Polyangiaceae bacterium]